MKDGDRMITFASTQRKTWLATALERESLVDAHRRLQ